MTDPLDVRVKRLRFRSWHRGLREMDLLLGRFADRYLDRFDKSQLDQYETLLEAADVDIYNWIAGRSPTPPSFDSPVLKLIKNFKLDYLAF